MYRVIKMRSQAKNDDSAEAIRSTKVMEEELAMKICLTEFLRTVFGHACDSHIDIDEAKLCRI